MPVVQGVAKGFNFLIASELGSCHLNAINKELKISVLHTSAAATCDGNRLVEFIDKVPRGVFYM